MSVLYSVQPETFKRIVDRKDGISHNGSFEKNTGLPRYDCVCTSWECDILNSFLAGFMDCFVVFNE